MGNTCSINTMIQCLGHCDLFRKFLLEEKQLFHKKKQYKFSMGDELRMICKQLWVDKDSLIPSRFLSALQETLGKDFCIGREQMDLTEVWMILIQNLLEESHQSQFKSNYLQTRSYSHQMLDYLHKEMVEQWTKHSQTTNSPLLDLVQGVQVQQMECKTCGKLYHNIEPFQCTYFELPEKEIVPFEECLIKWLEKDTVEDWKCDQCKSSTNEKVLRVWSLPKIWMIVLKRFHGLKKLHTPVNIPLELRLPDGFEMAEPSACSYQLKAIGNHYGSLYGGHYNAICKNDSVTYPWCLYDDLSIIDLKNISSLLQNNRDAYVLFFERC